MMNYLNSFSSQEYMELAQPNPIGNDTIDALRLLSAATGNFYLQASYQVQKKPPPAPDHNAQLSGFCPPSAQGMPKSMYGQMVLLPILETDFGYCSFIRPAVTFFSPDEPTFPVVMQRKMRFSKRAASDIQLGRDGGLHLVMDAEVCACELLG